MYVRYAVMADAVIPAGNGKWTVVGTFTTVFAYKFPASHHRFGVLVRIEAHPSEIGSHRLSLDIRDHDAKLIWQSPDKLASFEIGKPVYPNAPPAFEIGVELEGMTFPKEGNYDLSIRVDEKFIDSVPIYVREVKQKEKGTSVQGGPEDV